MKLRLYAQSSFARRLCSFREQAYLTQFQLAKNAGLSIGVIQNLEQGDGQNPRLRTLQRLASALDVSIATLAEDRPLPAVSAALDAPLATLAEDRPLPETSADNEALSRRLTAVDTEPSQAVSP